MTVEHSLLILAGGVPLWLFVYGVGHTLLTFIN